MVAAVVAHGISKRYHVARAANGQIYGYRTLRDDLANLAKLPFRMFSKENRPVKDDFWALRGVEFSIQQGDVVGIIGHNGAGKSTLLKILSRITKPTTGSIQLRGRVGSLLEVGTGFHPELTGRENLFLNGAILGMRRREILSKFDAIVEFAEIGQFLDTPVKRYSSGMYVRLAFAIAAHLEPEILIVDEVLAVGDLAFQRKCMGRMKEVGRSGATVLFVSHSMPAIEALCTRAMLIDHGKVARDGTVQECVTDYYRKVLQGDGEAEVTLDNIDSPARRVKAFRSAALLDAEGRPVTFVPMAGRFHLRVQLDCPQAVKLPKVTIGIDDNLGQRILNLITPATNPVIERLDGKATLDCIVDPFPLAPGDYWVKLNLGTLDDDLDEIERAMRFTITECDAFGEGHERHRGLAVAPSQWKFS